MSAYGLTVTVSKDHDDLTTDDLFNEMIIPAVLGLGYQRESIDNTMRDIVEEAEGLGERSCCGGEACKGHVDELPQQRTFFDKC